MFVDGGLIIPGKNNDAPIMKLKSRQFFLGGEEYFVLQGVYYNKNMKALSFPFCVTDHCICTVQKDQIVLTFARVSQVSDKFYNEYP